jgi:hypothetical protein
MGIYISGAAFSLITGNYFKNCIRGINSVSGNYNKDRNVYIFDWSSGLRGMGSTAGADFARDIAWFCDSNPTSGTFNQFDQNFTLTSNAMPNAGYFQQGSFVTNFSPTKDVNNLTLIGWVRLTSGNAHVSGTDWSNAYVKHTSP